jgi:hypothetical protein
MKSNPLNSRRIWLLEPVRAIFKGAHPPCTILCCRCQVCHPFLVKRL